MQVCRLVPAGLFESHSSCRNPAPVLGEFLPFCKYCEMSNEFEVVITSFSSVSEDCFVCLKEIYLIRQKIHDQTFRASDLSVLREIFARRQKGVNVHNPLSAEYYEKEWDFFSSNLFFVGTKMSRGKMDFFEFATNHENDTGTLQMYLSKVRKQMETAWYGILQKYGKIMIEASSIHPIT